MTATTVIRLIASLGLCPGLALLYLRWRDARRLGRWTIAAGWALVVAGLAGWTLSGHGDVALSDAFVVVMLAALGVIAGHATTLPAAAKAPHDRGRIGNDTLTLGRGYWGRVVARLLGCVGAAPAAGLMAGVLWRAYGPGDDADRLMTMAVLAVLVMAIAWVLQLMSASPWRILGLLSAAAAVAAGLVYIPIRLSA
jgi:hypothetical protein